MSIKAYEIFFLLSLLQFISLEKNLSKYAVAVVELIIASCITFCFKF